MTSAESPDLARISLVVIASAISRDSLAAALESVIAQSYRPDEILLVHDGSSDAITELISKYPDVSGVLAGAKGTVALRNRGIAASTGQYVVFLDGRHRLLPGALETGVSSLQRHPAYAFAYGRFLGSRESRHLEMETARRVSSDHYLELLRGDYIGTSSVVMYRRWALEAVGGYDALVKAAEDFALNLHLTRRFLAYGHGMPVAENVQHPAGDGGPAGRTIHGSVLEARTSISVLRDQYEHVRGNPHHEAAHRAGMQSLVIRHALVLSHELRDGARGAKTRMTIRDAIALIGFAGFLLFRCPRTVARCISRELVPWATRRWRVGEQLWALSSPAHATVGYDDSQETRRAVRTTVPVDATVLIYGPPDSDLPDLDGRCAVRFESASTGDPGAEQSDPTMTTLADRGGHGPGFMLIPASASWWFEHHDQNLKMHMDSAHTRIWADARCTLYQLGDDQENGGSPERQCVLVAGHFSFLRHGATAGDVMARDIVCEWLVEAGRSFDVALAPPFRGGVDWRVVRPERYSHVVFVCGPFSQTAPLMALLDRFPDQRFLGVNLSMVTSPESWNPFDVLIERDSVLVTRPDLTFLSGPADVPVIGICLREHSGGTRTAEAAIHRLVRSREMATLQIDTRLDGSQQSAAFAPRSPSEVEALLARVDLVITTRLHGMVLALKNGVPVIAIDPGNDGRKIISQAAVVGWPIAFDVHDITDEAMQKALDYCLTDEARSMAAQCAARARNTVAEARHQFIDAL